MNPDLINIRLDHSTTINIVANFSLKVISFCFRDNLDFVQKCQLCFQDEISNLKIKHLLFIETFSIFSRFPQEETEPGPVGGKHHHKIILGQYFPILC